MAGIMLTCPTCNSLEWKQFQIDDHRFQCKSCDQWFSEEELNIEFVEVIVE